MTGWPFTACDKRGYDTWKTREGKRVNPTGKSCENDIK